MTDSGVRADPPGNTEVPHDFNRCRCDQWGRCLVHCPTCDCVARMAGRGAADGGDTT